MAKAKKKATKKKVTSKKAPAKKAPAKKPAAKKKATTKKSVSKKKPVTKKTTKKKAVAKKKAAPAQKKTSSKKVASKKTTAKKTTKKSVAKKTPVAAKKTSKKATAKKTAAADKAPASASNKKAAESKKEAASAEKERVSKRAKIMALAKEAEAVSKKPKLVRKMVSLDEVTIDENYRPSDKEEYMCPKHLLYFQLKLKSWQDELIIESQETLENLRSETRDVGDEAERASRESDNILELRTRDRYRKLLRKIDEALKRIEDGTYGFCEETGDEIGIGRLEARPIATLTIDAQERREMFQRQFRDER